jgi:hypothetical protein
MQVFYTINLLSQGNNVLDSPVFNIDGFLPRDTVLLLFTWMEIVFIKVMFLTLENPEWQAVFLTKGKKLNCHKETMCKKLLPLQRLYCSIRCMSFSISSEEGIFHKLNESPTSKLFQIASILFTSLLNFHRETIWCTLLSLTQILLFHKINVFLHFVWIGYFS